MLFDQQCQRYHECRGYATLIGQHNDNDCHDSKLSEKLLIIRKNYRYFDLISVKRDFLEIWNTLIISTGQNADPIWITSHASFLESPSSLFRGWFTSKYLRTNFVDGQVNDPSFQNSPSHPKNHRSAIDYLKLKE